MRIFRFYTLAIAAMSLAGCSEGVESDGLELSDTPITFAVGDAANADSAETRAAVADPTDGFQEPREMSGYTKPLYLHQLVQRLTTDDNTAAETRGAVTTTSNLSSFYVTATRTTNDDDLATTAPNFINDDEVTKSSNKWQTATTYLWPGNDDHLSFYAYSPKGTGTNGPTLKTGQAGDQVISYTVPEDPTEQVDLITAFNKNLKNTVKGTQDVPLTFNHALTAINFVVAKDLIPGTIKSVAVSGVCMHGEYTIGADGTAGTWDTTVSSPSGFTVTLGTEFTGGSADDIALNAAEQTFMMIPQSFGSDSEAKITLVFNDGERDYTLDVPLKNTKWEAGKTVTYKISSSKITTLELGSINFANNSDWNAAAPKSSFVSGDAAGMYVVDQNGNVRNDNVCLTYDGTQWTASETVNYSPQFQYFAYYPYSGGGLAHEEGSIQAGTTASDFFASGISAFSPAADQSTAASFNASDLQVAKATVNRTTASDISFAMSHAMGLASITLGSKSISSITPVTTTTTYTATNLTTTSYSQNATYGNWTTTETKNETGTTTVTASSTFSGNTPYKKSSTLYGFIMKPATATSFAGTGTDGWSLSTRAASGAVAKSTVQSSRTSVTNAAQTKTATADYTVKLGDVVYTDGAISRPTTTYSGKTKMAMVVYLKEHEAWAMALKDDNLTNGASSNRYGAAQTYTYNVSLPSGYHVSNWYTLASYSYWISFITAFGGTASNTSPSSSVASTLVDYVLATDNDRDFGDASGLCSAMVAAGGDPLVNDYWTATYGYVDYKNHAVAINPSAHTLYRHEMVTYEHVRCVYKMTIQAVMEK